MKWNEALGLKFKNEATIATGDSFFIDINRKPWRVVKADSLNFFFLQKKTSKGVIKYVTIRRGNLKHIMDSISEKIKFFKRIKIK